MIPPRCAPACDWGVRLRPSFLCRGMRGKEAVKKCPELQLVQVPVTHGKAELGPYRAAGKQVRRATCSGSSHSVE